MISDLHTIVLPAGTSGRLDAALSALLPHVSRRALKLAFREHRVLVAGRPARGAEPASAGLEVTLLDLPARPLPLLAPALPLELLFADEHLVAVDKPAGVPAYPLTPHEPGTVAGALLSRFPDLAGVGDQPLAPGLCHRLDKETSGVLLFARTAAAFAAVRAAFHARRVDKVYHAVVAGRLAGEGVVGVPLAHAGARGSMMVAVAPGSRPQHARSSRTWPARTRWRALAERPEGTLVELALETGVTHQARVHMAHLGHPILGDERYGGPAAARLFLHARRLGLAHPATGDWLRIESTGEPF